MPRKINCRRILEALELINLRKELSLKEIIIFTDVMDPGVKLINSHGFMIPDYLTISNFQTIKLADHLNPAELQPSSAYVYDDNLYLTDATGNIAFIDAHLIYTTPTEPLRRSHPEYRKVSKHGHDAGHIGLSIGQHPSLAMEQDAYMNRFGIWRVFERYWNSVLKEGREVRLIAVFVEGEDSFSPFWCIHEEIDGVITEYIFTNDDEQ